LPVVIVALGAVGCGGAGIGSATLQPVKGQVLLADGKPLAGCKVVFFPKQEAGTMVEASTDSNGAFSIEGAAPGEYKIRIVPGAKYISKSLGRVDPKLLPFSPTYMDEDGNTGLTAVVKAEPTQLEPLRLADARGAAPRGGSND
jgi:hypothetical protein